MVALRAAPQGAPASTVTWYGHRAHGARSWRDWPPAGTWAASATGHVPVASRDDAHRA